MGGLRAEAKAILIDIEWFYAQISRVFEVDYIEV